MTTLLNKSNHPVNIKRINVRVWTLRDEIEACIQKRIEEQGSDNVDIEDIKSFYSSLIPKNKSFDDMDDDDLEDVNHQPGVEDTSEIDGDEDENEASAQEGSEDDLEDSEESEGAAGEMADEVIEAAGDEEAAQDQENPASFQRVIPSEDKMIYGFAFLSEIHMDQLLFFGKKAYTNGQSIVVEFLIPNRFSVSAEVVNTLHIDRGSRIISDTKPSHRVQGDFTFLFDGERGHLRDFLKSVEPEVPPPPKRIKRQDSEDGDDDDFDDLGF